MPPYLSVKFPIPEYRLLTPDLKEGVGCRVWGVGGWGNGETTSCALRGEVGKWGSGGISTKTLKP
ncbi:hypothetical protein B5D77_00940 [Microcystis sp. MC19]|nr:hypothetical protein B5D77_00940 [Microcystis sp. MC19]